MALVDAVITATLPPAVIAEVATDAIHADFKPGGQEVQVKVPCPDKKLRGNRLFDVKEAANEARTKAGKPSTLDGLVIRGRSKLVGATLTVTLYWGKEVVKT